MTATIIPFPAKASANVRPCGQPEGPLYVHEDGTIPSAQEQAIYLMARGMLREMWAKGELRGEVKS
jgi:hypothetical protein